MSRSAGRVRLSDHSGKPETGEARRGLYDDPRQPGVRERREPATDARLDGDQVTANPDDGDAGHATAAYIIRGEERSPDGTIRTL
jgi:hypothetical protein